MSSKKITELTELTTSADDDLIVIVDTSAEETKKQTKVDLLKEVLFWDRAGTVLSPHTAGDSIEMTSSIKASSFKTGAYTLTVDETESLTNYLTSARADTWLGTKDTGDLSEGTNLYWTTARGDARYLYKGNTDAFTPDADYEPATKKYVDDSVTAKDEFTELSDTPSNYTDDGLKVVRVNTGETALEFVDLSTTEVDEGTNLYYTDVRARAAISETVTGLSYNSGTGVLSLTSGYVIPTTTQETNWGTAYDNRITSWTLPLLKTDQTASLNYAAPLSLDGSNNLYIAADAIKDTHIDWGTGASQVSSVDIPDHNSHTIRDTFVHTVNRGVAEAITVTLTGGLGVSWSAGEIYDIANHTFVAVEAGSGTVTNNAVNYLKWVSGTTLTLATSDATGNEVLIAIGTVYDGVINGYREMSLLDESLANIRRCARAVFPTRVTSGMSVHEDTDATNPLDVTMDAGVYCKEIQERITPVEIKSRNTAMVRHFHTAGAWDSDTNAEIETTNYDNGTQKTAIPSNKWVKGLFIFMNGKIGFVYPTECFNTTAEAQDASLPAMPTGLEPVPKLTAIVYQQGAVNFTGAIWQDVRAGISEEAFAGITDHGALAGLADDDHTQYLLKAGGTMTGALEARDHGTAATDEVVNVAYGTGDPPVANTTTIGSLFIKYVA